VSQITIAACDPGPGPGGKFPLWLVAPARQRFGLCDCRFSGQDRPHKQEQIGV